MSSAPHTGDALPLFCCPASNRGALSRPQGGRFRRCTARITAELRHSAGRNPPMPATPTPREMQCRVSAAQSPFGRRFPVHKRPLPTLRYTYRRPSAQNRAMPLGATRPSPPPPPPQETQCRVSAAQSPFGGRFPVHRRPLPTLRYTHRRPSAQNRAMPLGATRPSTPPPPPQETPCRVSVAQSPNEGRCSVHKATVATFQLPPLA